MKDDPQIPGLGNEMDGTAFHGDREDLRRKKIWRRK